MDENRIFTHNQLKALLLGCGYTHCVGVDLGDGEMDREQALCALNELTAMGLISSDGDGFTGTAEAKRIAAALGGSPCYIAVHTKTPGLPDLCCLGTGSILVCLPYAGDRVAVRLSGCQALFSALCEEGYLPRDGEGLALDEKALEDYEAPVFAFYDPNAPLATDSRILFSAEQITRDGAVKACLRVIEYHFYNHIYYSANGQITRLLYSREALGGFFKGLMSSK